MKEIIDRINALKKEKNALILGHTYTHPEVQDISDYVVIVMVFQKKLPSQVITI